MPAERRSRSVTRADVARYAGVSTAVVSYVLNDGPKAVAPLTKERVLDAVRVLGYRPNAAARALSMGSADMFGLLVHDNRSPFFAELCHALDQATADAGRSLLIVNSDRTQTSTSEQIRDLLSRQIGGLIIADVLTAGEQSLVESLGIPAVVIGQFGETDGLHSVGVDFSVGAREATEHLIGHGYREIAFAGSAARYDARERGWREALTSAHLPLGPLVHTPFTYQGGYDAAVELLDGASRPRAVLAASDQIAIGMLAAFGERGVRVPDDIAIVSFDGTVVADFVWPRLTTAVQPLEQMADAAVRLLLEPDAVRDHRAFRTRLRIRESCGCTASA
ncbi:LacI family DNA-binding transcriptional regulator [Microbacterium arabinogalactanolyticum]|uniref:LacI family DNA-binding transcriptional regulator n=1 Tax=Microbacterium arabinogalactanolyticum TaxID=69365 RepID=UPI002557B317|nr:LacI family DNA-binding transcriptional regulator [Microbacterium arabinogalactanolyticum]GLC86807.1 LacI family transcriptional regulator [Microbacterium arabinogalactanolyticum]